MKNSMLALRKDEIDIVGGGILLQLGYGGSAFFAGVIEALRYKDLESYQAIKRFNKNNIKGSAWSFSCAVFEDLLEFGFVMGGIKLTVDTMLPYLFIKLYGIVASVKG